MAVAQPGKKGSSPARIVQMPRDNLEQRQDMKMALFNQFHRFGNPSSQLFFGETGHSEANVFRITSTTAHWARIRSAAAKGPELFRS
jgi:hypothetical protein